MNANCFMEQRREAQGSQNQDEADDETHSPFWHWFAFGVLMFCWIAEASMCADRGF
jgi:hypothetical protein